MAERSQDLTLGPWVYCRSHLRPHKTGWCTVPNSEKLGLGAFPGDFDKQSRAALAKCRSFGFVIYGENLRS